MFFLFGDVVSFLVADEDVESAVQADTEFYDGDRDNDDTAAGGSSK